MVKQLKNIENIEQLKELTENTDNFNPWIKNIVNDNNIIAFQDGLIVLEQFVKSKKANKQSPEYYVSDLLSRQCK